MKLNAIVLVSLSASLIALAAQLTVVNAQILDQLLGGLANRVNRDTQPEGGSRNIFKDMMSVNVPMFYDMVKNGSSMGINVMSGLVKVERGEEAERSGLQGTGARKPLSVRIFGVPVYERGVRVRNPEVTENGSGSKGNVPPGSEDEELPIYN